MAASTPVILAIADISGYTRFMHRHPVASSHAREITVRLLNAVVSRLSHPLQVAEIEGDAVFFFVSDKDAADRRSIEKVKRQLIGLFSAFRAEVKRLKAMDACSCEACSSVGALRLKQVIHAGEATIERVGRFDKLFSLDVILVHRLLKNSVEGGQYILLTAPAYEAFAAFPGVTAERRSEEVEGFGTIDSFVLRDGPIESSFDPNEGPDPTPTQLERLMWKLRLRWSELRPRDRLRE